MSSFKFIGEKDNNRAQKRLNVILNQYLFLIGFSNLKIIELNHQEIKVAINTKNHIGKNLISLFSRNK